MDLDEVYLRQIDQKLKQNKLDQIERVKQMDREVNGGV